VAATYADKNLTYREGATGPGDVTQWIYEGHLQVLVPAFWSLYYSLDGLAQTLESDEAVLPLPEQFYIGGARTVRGYRENQFHGRRIAYGRNELRLGRTPREGFYCFADAGYVLQPTTAPDGLPAQGRHRALGLRVRVRSASRRSGRIDLSFAVTGRPTLRRNQGACAPGAELLIYCDLVLG
jgi:hemolysin activation/secretion protein